MSLGVRSCCIRVLGSAAGGGFPQWNCGCPNCRGVRAGDAPRDAAHPGIGRGQRGRRALVPAQRLAGDPPADRELPRAAPARPAPLADRTPSSSPTAISITPSGLLSLRESHPAGGLRHRARSPRLHRGQRALPDARALPRPGDLAHAQARPRGEALAGADGRPSGLLVEAVPVPGKLPDPPRGPAPAPTPRTTSGSGSARRATGRRLAYFPAAGGLTAGGPRGPRRRRLRVLRRHLLVERRAARARARHQARRGHGAPAGGRRGRQPGRAPRAAARRAGSTSTSTTRTRSCATTRRSATEAEAAGWEVAWDGMEVQPVTHGRRSGRRSRREEFIEWVRREGEQRYHDHHRYHALMHEGKLTPAAAPAVGAEPLLLPDAHPHQGRHHPVEVRGSRLPAHVDPPHPRPRRRRRAARAGSSSGCGWPTGVGLDREEVASCRSVLPGVRFACDAYVELVRERSLVEAVASSLTEFFAPDLMSKRMLAWEKHYPWVSADMLAYFRSRVPRARQRLAGGHRLRRAPRDDARDAGALRRRAHPEDRDPLAPARLHVRRVHRAGLGARGGARHVIDAESRPAPGRQGPPPLRPQVVALHAALPRARPRAERDRRRRAPALRRRAHRRRDRRASWPRSTGTSRPRCEREVLDFLQTHGRPRPGAGEPCERGRARPYTLVAELTYRCPLRCVYCSNPLDYAPPRPTSSTPRPGCRVLREAEDARRGAAQPHGRRAARARRPRGARRGGARGSTSTRT